MDNAEEIKQELNNNLEKPILKLTTEEVVRKNLEHWELKKIIEERNEAVDQLERIYGYDRMYGPTGDGKAFISGRWDIRMLLTNIQEILKKHPEITEVYCTAFGTGTIVSTQGRFIKVKFQYTTARFDIYGRLLTKNQTFYNDEGECILFPSEEKKVWQ